MARFVFILAATSLLSAFGWLVLVFGAFLLFTALRMVRGQDADPQDSRVLGLVRRVLLATGDYRGDHLFVRENCNSIPRRSSPSSRPPTSCSP